MEAEQTIEERITQWREYLTRHDAIRSVDSEELEDHLRSQIAELSGLGLKDDEAFLVAVKRMGDLNSVSLEFAREYSERLWKQLVIPARADEGSSGVPRDALVAVGLAVAAAGAVKLPQLFGMPIGDSPEVESFYVRNFSLLILPFLAAYFAWKRGLGTTGLVKVTVPFLFAGLAMNLLPFTALGYTEVLSAIHLPIALWFIVGTAYMGGRWDSHPQRMNFVRFSGEMFIYMALIALGGGVLMGFTVLLFQSIGLDPESFAQSWLMPCGVAGAIVICGWLVEAKQSIIENMAPVLTRLFTPLFTILLLSYIGTMIWSGKGILDERNVLIGFDLLMVLILGLVLYSISARDHGAPPDLFDKLQFLLVVCVLIVDSLALWAISKRISDFGFSPNKVAALGENLILLVNLAGTALLYGRFLMKRCSFATLEHWQTAYVPVYPIWAGFVVVVFPIIFNFM